MATAIEIKYGQDNVDSINKAILTGLPWDGLTPEKILEFFKTLNVYTKLSDYRFIDHHFKIMGIAEPKREPGYGIPARCCVYEVAFRRGIKKDPAIPEGCVGFEAYIYGQEDILIGDVMDVIHTVYREGSQVCSAAVINSFSLRMFATIRKGDNDYDVYKDYLFRFGSHGHSHTYIYPDHGVQS
jgi:hypothetical protein